MPTGHSTHLPIQGSPPELFLEIHVHPQGEGALGREGKAEFLPLETRGFRFIDFQAETSFLKIRLLKVEHVKRERGIASLKTTPGLANPHG